MYSIVNRDYDERPFTATRVIKPGSSTATAPKVVSCYWSPINTENLYAPTMTEEEMDRNVGCNKHGKSCRGHLRMDPTRTTYMILHGFAIGDELRNSDAYVMNKMIMDGRKEMSDMSKFCFDRIAGKRGILRKSCNGTRPTNSFRFVASPSRGPMNVIYLPNQLFDKGEFVYVYPSGRCVMRKLVEGDPVLIGRCPAQGSESTLPMIAMRGAKGSSSALIPLEMCPRNNADFDGDEVYGVVPATEASKMELLAALERVWNPTKIPDIIANVSIIVNANGGDETIDPAMYSTMPLEDMETHPGGKMYDLLMLKPKTWKIMAKTMKSKTYWKTWVTRSEQGIANTIMGRHGIAGPYGYMRAGMMLGTCVITSSDKVTINSMPAPNLPSVDTVPGMERITCSSALTKLTKVLYQRGIDTAKHGEVTSLMPAMETFMRATNSSYVIKQVDGKANLALAKDIYPSSYTNPCTSLEWIVSEGARSNIITSAIIATSMIEEVDNVMLTPQERIMASVLFAFMSTKITAFMDVDPIDIVYPLALDWYTAVTCSNVRWLKNVIRNPSDYPHVRMDTNIDSTLGAIFLGNMSLITNENTGEHGHGTVKMNSDTEVIDWASDY